MEPGEVWQRANVTIDDQLIKGVRAIIYNGLGRLLEADGTLKAEMSGPITVSDYTGTSVTWTNGSQTWNIENAGCACGPK